MTRPYNAIRDYGTMRWKVSRYQAWSDGSRRMLHNARLCKEEGRPQSEIASCVWYARDMARKARQYLAWIAYGVEPTWDRQ